MPVCTRDNFKVHLLFREILFCLTMNPVLGFRSHTVRRSAPFVGGVLIIIDSGAEILVRPSGRQPTRDYTIEPSRLNLCA